MKLKSLYLGAVLAACVLHAHAAELTLFGQTLKDVSRPAIEAAAKANGAQLTTSGESKDVFDTSALGLPDANHLEVVYLNNRVVMAQYKLDASTNEADEQFRKMLVAKYGKPQTVDGEFHDTSSHFDAPYLGEGKYRWHFPGNMQLVFTREFFGDRYLTYVNMGLQAQVQRLLDTAAKNGASKSAQAKQDLF